MLHFTRLLCLVCGLLLCVISYAQKKTITGIVTGDGARNPLAGVTVTNRTTDQRTQTNNAGRYSIEAVPGHVLLFSSVGYSTGEQLVGSASTYDIQMTSSARQLEEVTISQGIRRPTRSLGYSNQKVDGEDLTQTNRDNFFTALQGRVAGLTVTPTSGVPGASSQIILRGPVSFDGNNQPLLVVDGLPISNRTMSQGTLVSDGPNRNNDYSNRGMDLNPDDIETMTILTGPEAAALYGTDGASGVILITTKRAKAGTTKVTYNSALTVTRKPELPEIFQLYDQGDNGIVDNNLRRYFGPKFAPGTKLYDNKNAFFQVAFSQKHDLSFEGGTEKLSYRFSPSFSRYNGTVPNTKLDKTSLRLAVTSQVSDPLKLDASFNYIVTDNIKGSKGLNSYFLSLLSWPADDDITQYLNSDGSRKKIAGGTTAESDNPFWDVNKNINRDKTNRMLGNVALTYSPFKWLSFTGRLGADIYTTDGIRLYHPESNSGIGTGGFIENYVDNTRIYNGNLVANVRKSFGKISNNISIGSNFDNNRTDINSFKGEKFYSVDFNSINNTDPATMRNKLSTYYVKKFGYFGNWTLGFSDFLYLSLTGRMDASSTLIPNDPYFFYPGAGLSFVFSELTKGSVPWLSFGKLKANIASTGKDARNPFLTSSRLNPQLSNGGGFALNVTLGNPNLKPEFTNTYEFGTELSFFNSRLGVDFTYYNIRTDQQITAPRLSYATGGVLAYLNSGEVENKGIQVQVNATPVRKKDFTWRTIMNYTQNKGKILSVPAGQKSFYMSDTWLYAGVRGEFVTGTSISSLSSQGFRRNNKGDVVVDPATGLPVRDVNYTVRADRAPDFAMGFVNNFTYKNLSFSFVIDTRKGGDVFNGNELYLTTLGLSKFTSTDRENLIIVKGVLLDGLENTDNPTPNTITINPYYNQAYYNGQYSEEDFIEKDINWIRLQDVSLRYTLPMQIFANRKFIKGIELGLSAANLFLFSNYTGVDPAVSGLNASVGGFSGTGIDYGVLPSSKTMTFNLNVRF